MGGLIVGHIYLQKIVIDYSEVQCRAVHLRKK